MTTRKPFFSVARVISDSVAAWATTVIRVENDAERVTRHRRQTVFLSNLSQIAISHIETFP